MLESQLEKKLTKTIQTTGGLCWKFISPGTAGVPDRIAILPGGKIIFIELKTPTGRTRPIQTHRHNQLKKLGATIRIIRNTKDIQKLIKENTK